MQPKTVFERNIEALKSNKNNYELLEYEIRTNIDIIETNGYNLAYEGQPIHNTTSPLGEAKYLFDSVANANSAITIVYGIGLGYLFQYTAQNSKGVVILYEPNIDILKKAFQLVDFSNEIKSDNVFVATDKSHIDSVLRTCFNENNYPEVVCLPSYRKIFPKQFEETSEMLKMLVGIVALDFNFTKNRFLPIASLILQNVPYLVKEPPLCAIKDVYAGKTAVVCSAGPTLAENIETLKKYKDNVVIISVGPAYKSLLNAGIMPDFVCIVEDRNAIGQIRGLDVSNIAMVLEPSSNITFHEYALNAKKTFCHASNNLPPNSIWADLSGCDTSEYETKGSVSYCALNVARILGCKRLVVVGQDLAYLDGRLYSKDSMFKDLKLRFDEEKNKYEVYVEDWDNYASIVSQSKDKEHVTNVINGILETYDNKLTQVKGITGEMLPTQVVYATFVQGISKFAQQHPEIEFINTSLRGAKLEGFRDAPLEDALINTTPLERFDVTSVTADSVDVVKNLKGLISMLDYALEKINENYRLLVRFRTEYVRHKILTKEMLQTMKKIVNNYVFLSIDYAQKNLLFDFITKKEQIEFESYLQRMKDIDLNVALKLAELQTKYLDATVKNIEDIKAIINNSITEIERV